MEIFLNAESFRPVVAILSIDNEIRGFTGNRSNYKDLIQAGEVQGIFVYVITPRELILTNKKVLGYIFDSERGSWHRQWVPLPDVVYNRIPYRKHELIPEVHEKIAECLKHPRIRLFNPAFFNKWTLFEWLKKSENTRRYIPLTRKLSSLTVLQSLMKQFPILYLKPERGKAGKGIMRIKVKTSRGEGFQLSVQEDKNCQFYTFDSLMRLWHHLIGIIGSEDYIVQQGIELASTQKRPFDLRVLVQKNITGGWILTGIGARVAGVLNITTHVPRGGTIDDPEKLLSAAFNPFKAKKIMAAAKSAALRIARQIEKGAGSSLGEMSIDLGVDTSGRLWFFEANAKPMEFDEPHIRSRSLELLMQYCTYLSKKRNLKSRL